ncbi:MAG TPA: hypothetical protein VI434_12200 [Candidatus Dormibacteraeota bacterium]
MRRFGLTLRAGAATAVVVGMAAAASPASAAAGGVNHWGYLFAKAHLAPTVMSIPGTVVQVASSNTTLYALTTTGNVYA